MQADATEQTTIEQPQIKALRPVELNLGSACGKFALGEGGWQQSVQEGDAAGVADADATKKLLAENNMLKLKIDLLVDMLARARANRLEIHTSVHDGVLN